MIAGSRQFIDVIDVQCGKCRADSIGQTVLPKKITIGLGGGGEAAWDLNSKFRKVADHLAQRGIFSSDAIDIIHSYALMIIAVAAFKISGIVPTRIEQACSGWYRFVVANFTAALLVGIGIAFTDLDEVLRTVSPSFVILIFTAVLTIVIASGYIGTCVGFYFVESALTSGLGMADMGGTGDVAVLSAAKRMELMPFMQISSRLGGALILVLVSIFASMLLQ